MTALGQHVSNRVCERLKPFARPRGFGREDMVKDQVPFVEGIVVAVKLD
jgi:hypothetical protein